MARAVSNVMEAASLTAGAGRGSNPLFTAGDGGGGAGQVWVLCCAVLDSS